MNEKTKSILENIIFTIMIMLVISIFVTALIWANYRTDKLMESSKIYEECIMAQYNTTPSAYYNEYGDYPYCDN